MEEPWSETNGRAVQLSSASALPYFGHPFTSALAIQIDRYAA